MVGVEGAAERSAQVQLQAIEGERDGERGEDAAGQGRERLLVDVVADDQQGELVAAEASDELGVAGGHRQAPGERVQQPVADLMAERVVELLEAVEVDDQEADARVVAQRLLEREQQLAAVGQSGELVGDGLLAALEQAEVLAEGERRRAA